MCGITGLVRFKEHSEPINEALLRSMNSKLTHRGPDDEGYYIDNQGPLRVGLGMRRLSIIDLVTGHQPIGNENGEIWVILNGEIYNYRELKNLLVQKGHIFKTETDTEVLVHLYEDYGTELATKLRGMYAFAIYDRKTQKVVLARDRVGKKPLFYSMENGVFAFASEMKALLEIPGFSGKIAPASIDEYLTYGYISSPRSIFHNISKLPPAHILSFQGDGLKIQRYWQLDFNKKKNISFARAKDELNEVIREAVKIRLRSDVPLGAFLSGGMDSSIITHTMAALMEQPVKTFTIGFEEQEYSEIKYARMVAEQLHTEHHEIIVKPDAINDLPKIVYYYGEPFSDSSALPSYYVAREARKYVSVVLNGDGGDESFAGYPRYKANEFFRLLDPVLKIIRSARLSGLVSRFPESGISRRLKTFIRLVSYGKLERNMMWHTVFSNEEKMGLLTDSFIASDYQDRYNLLRDKFNNAQASNDLERFLSADINQYLPEDLLVKMDIATMMNSLEARSPFLDQQLMEYAASLPPDFKIRFAQSKYILKKMYTGFLPETIINRPKMGFGLPISYWFRNSLSGYVKEMLLSREFFNRGYFKRKPVENLLSDHFSGGRDNSYRIWNLLFLELWHRIYIDKTM